MNRIPQNSAGFERDFNVVKRDMNHLHKYIKNIPLSNLEKLFKNSEVSTEVLSAILQSLAEVGVEKDSKHTADFLISLSKSSNFDMTLMFLEDKEKKDILVVLKGLEKEKSID